MNIKLYFIVLFAGSLSAQLPQKITLKDALGYALQNKADAKKAKLQIKESQAQVVETAGDLYPHISLSGNAVYNPLLQKYALPGELFGMPGTTVMSTLGGKWATTAGVSLSQNIFNMPVFARLKAAKTTREFYQLNATLTNEQVIERVATAYYNVFVQKEQLEAINSNYTVTKKTRDIIYGLWKNGLAKRIDLDKVDVQLANVNSAKQQLVNAVKLQENALKFYMGMPIATPIELSKADFNPAPILLDSNIDVEDRTEFKLLKKQEQLLLVQKRISRSSHYPSLSVSAGYFYQGMGPKFPIGAKETDDVYWSNYASIGLNLFIPLFSGFTIKAKVDQAKAELQKLREDLDDAKLSMELDYQNAKVQINNSLELINNQKENVNLAQKVMNNMQNNYINGLSTLTDLLEAQNSLVQTKNNYSNAVLQFKIAEIQLLKAKGSLYTLMK